jgi:N-acyl homoserine lactone hydrolase
VRFEDIRRLHVNDVVGPPGHPLEGQSTSVFAFSVAHPNGVIVFDTGFPEHPELEIYRPRVWPLTEQGLDPADVIAVINCHLHFDHCGFNSLFPDVPIYAQRREYERRNEPDYTIPEFVDFPGARYELLDGEAEVLPGIRVLPTPGHTPGHQSAVLEDEQGIVVLAGQAADSVAEWRDSGDPSVRKLKAMGPRRVYLSHDPGHWEPEG